MVIALHYSHPTTPAGAGFDEVLADALAIALFSGGSVQASDAMTGLVQAAIAGDVAQSSIILDDPDGTLGHNADGIPCSLV